jgi:Cu/Ag efflux pump CusA
VPIVLGGTRAGYEIEHPLAVVILGGLFTSTLLNLFIVPALYLKYGRSALTKWKRRSLISCLLS